MRTPGLVVLDHSHHSGSLGGSGPRRGGAQEARRAPPAGARRHYPERFSVLRRQGPPLPQHLRYRISCFTSGPICDGHHRLLHPVFGSEEARSQSFCVLLCFAS
jgi:hypothetical protein